MGRPKLKEIVIHCDWCKGRGVCIHFCPKHVFEKDAFDKGVAAHLGNYSAPKKGLRRQGAPP